MFSNTRDGHDYPYRGHGLRIPTLEALLKDFPLAYCNIEIKQADPPIVAQVVEVIQVVPRNHGVHLRRETDLLRRAHARRHQSRLGARD